MAQGRSKPSLCEIEPLLREIDDAYHVGVHLGVPAEKLKEFERNHPRDVARQRTEAVNYWLNNCKNVTWNGLADAVEKLGGHSNLVEKLRERAQESSCQDDARIEAEKELQQKELLECEQTPLAELKSPLKLKWRQGEDMPFDMIGSAQAVVIGDDVYVGGGSSLHSSETVMVYSVKTGSWTTLPPHETKSFGMASVNNQLVLVGGTGVSTRVVTDVLVVWDERLQIWTRPFPVMPTARHSPSVISYQKWLVVAGGEDDRDSPLNKVELLDTQSGWWCEGLPLPAERSSMSSAINGNMWYLSGGVSSKRVVVRHVFSVCLDELISQAVSQSASSASSPWQTLPKAPVEKSTLLILNGSLLTVGGWSSASIHHYQPSSSSWVKVGGLPVQLGWCTCTVLPNGEMFVAGGVTFLFPEKHINIATIFD